MVEISGAVWMQVLISLLGILIMIAAAAMITWYKKIEGRSSARVQNNRTPISREARYEGLDCGIAGRMDLIILALGVGVSRMRSLRRAGVLRGSG